MVRRKTFFSILIVFCTVQFSVVDVLACKVRLVAECNDNMTPCDPSDDYYDVSGYVYNDNHNTTWVAIINGVSYGPFPSVHRLEYFGRFPANGLELCVDFETLAYPYCRATKCTNPLIPCSSPIQLELFVAECNDNMTPCDPGDDYYELTIKPHGNGSNATWVVTINGVPFGPFADGTLQKIGNFSANGQQLCADFYYEHAPSCTATRCTNPLVPCVATIQIQALDLICDDNGTANDPSDDFYKVSLVVTMLNADPAYPYGYYADVAGMRFGPYSYGAYVNFELPADGGVHKLIVTDENDPICMDMRDIGPLTPCSVPCALIAQVLHMECFDNGTPDPSDDFYKITISATASVHGAAGKYKLDADYHPPLQLPYGKTFDILLPANGQYATLVFTDVDYRDCFMELEIGPLDPCSKRCEVMIDTLGYQCFDNGTPDPSDDYYEVCIRVSGTDAGSGYEIFTKHGQFGPYFYDEKVILTVPADGEELNIAIRDVDFPTYCKTTALIGPLDPCSEPCELDLVEFVLTCHDSATANLADDYYEIKLQVDRADADITDMYEVVINGTVFGPYSYGQQVTITWPADGGTYDMYVRDVVLGSMCEQVRSVGPLEPCSSPCDLSVLIENIICNDAGTGQDPSDDTYSFDLTVNGVNVSANWVADDPMMTTAAYGSTVNFGPYLISGGDVRLIIQDVNDPYCRTIVDVEAPEPCSDSCLIDQYDVIIGPCDDNGTGPDTLDDFYFVDLLVNGVNVGAGSTFEVSWSNQNWGPFTYGDYHNIGPLPADGSVVTLQIVDSDIGYCELSLDVSSPHCSECVETADAGPEKTLTCSIEDVDLEGSSSAGGTFTWYGPNSSVYTGAYPKVDQPGWYKLVVTFENGCMVEDSVEVLSDTLLPVASLIEPGQLTCKIDSVEIDGTNSTSGQDIIYKWTDQNGTVIGNSMTTTVTLPGTYCLEVVDTVLDCSSGLSCIQVEENRAAPDALIFVDPDNVLNCKVDSVRLTAGSSPNSIFHWEFRSRVYHVDTMWLKDTGMVYLIATDTITGCTTMIEMEIEALVEYPIVNVAEPAPLTCAVTEVTIDGSLSQSGSHIFYQWYDDMFDPIPGGTSRTLNVTAPGTYYFQVTDSINGCENIDTVVVDLDQFFHPIDAGPDALLRCDDNTTVLSGSTSSSVNDMTISWEALDGGQILEDGTTLTPTVDGSGRYEVTVIDNRTGCVTKDTVRVEDPITPLIEGLALGDEVCLGEEDGWIDIRSVVNGTAPYSYYVNGQLVSAGLIQDLSPGTYQVEVVDALGCRTDTTLVIAPGVEFAVDLVGITQLIQGDTTRLTATTTILNSNIDKVTWHLEDGTLICDNCASIDVSPDTTTTYLVTVTDKNGCIAENLITIYIKDKNQIWAPNVFTPNGDGSNDFFRIFGKNLVQIEQLLLFDRWGELVYTGENLDLEEGWDGTLNGEDMNPAVFVYYAVGVFKNGEKASIYGDVTLLR